jgi:hypothetical protein
MWFRYLTASAACAALLGLAASGFMRTHFSEVMSALAWRPSEDPPSRESAQADRGVPAAIEAAPEGVTPETPTSQLPPKAAKGHPAGPVRPASAHRPVRDTFSQDLNQGIRKLPDRRYEIKRGTLELALGNLGLLARSVRVMPEVRDGKAFGFRLLGLRNDDVLVSINGLDLTTPERVLDAYGKLKQAPRLVLGLLRRGHEHTQEYVIR